MPSGLNVSLLSVSIRISTYLIISLPHKISKVLMLLEFFSALEDHQHCQIIPEILILGLNSAGVSNQTIQVILEGHLKFW